MKKLTCTQCGASINPVTLTCEYCGSVYLNSDNNTKPEVEEKSKRKKESKIIVDKITDEQLGNIMKKYCASNFKNNFIGIVFMIIWTTIAFSISIASTGVLDDMNDFGGLSIVKTVSIAPFLMAGFGLFIAINLIVSSFKGQVNKEIKLIKEGKYKEAHDSLEKKESKKHNVNYVLGLILIDYYRFEDFAEAKKHILNLPPKELAILINKDSRLLDIASNLGIMTPNYNSNDNDSYSNDGYTYTM